MAAYVVFIRERTRDPKELALYSQQRAEFVKGHSITPRAAYGRIETLEGPPAEGVVILEFPTFEEARTWYHGDAYTKARVHRNLGSDYRVLIVDGL